MPGRFVARGLTLQCLAASIALLLGFSTTLVPTSAASQSEAIVPPGTIDAAARTFGNLENETAPAYSFIVYTFETDDDAQSAADQQEQLLIRAASAGPDEVLGTPIASDITEDTVSDELLASVDSAVSQPASIRLFPTQPPARSVIRPA